LEEGRTWQYETDARKSAAGGERFAFSASIRSPLSITKIRADCGVS
jgi:hypothetical protein